MKKGKRKYLSIQKRDLWDGPHDYLFDGFPTAKLKYMLKHVNKRDRRLKGAIMNILRQRKHEK